MATTITANGINFPDGSASAPSIGGTDTNTGLFTGSDLVGFATGGNERLRITSDGELLVGTTVDNGFKFKVSDGGGYEFAFAPNDSSINSLVNYNRSGGAYVDCKIVQKELQLWTGTSPSEKLRLTSTGAIQSWYNSSLPVTDSRPILQLGYGVIGDNSSGYNDVTCNAYPVNGDSSYHYIGSSSLGATRYQLTFGSHIWSTASAGTRGNDITWSEKLRLDSNGRLLLGTTTEGHSTADDLTISAAGSGGITIRTPSNTEGNIYFSDGTSGDAEYKGYIQYNHSSDRLYFGSDGGLTLTLDSSHNATLVGRLYISHDLTITGTAPRIILTDSNNDSDFRINVDGGSFQIQDSTNSYANRFVIDSDGMAKFTRGSTGTVGHFYANARECNILLQNDARTWKIVNYDYTNAGADNLGFHDGTADRFIIKNNGNVQIPDGDLEVASGHGIDFSATADNAGKTSEVLNDYEEGSFTMFFWTSNTSFSTAPTMTTNNCKYTKIGTQVTFSAYIGWGNQAAGGAGALYLGGLPYSINNNSTYGAISFGWYSTGGGFSANEHLVGYYNNNSTNIVLLRQAIGSSGGRSYSTLPHSAIVGSSGTFGISGTYIANS